MSRRQKNQYSKSLNIDTMYGLKRVLLKPIMELGDSPSTKHKLLLWELLAMDIYKFPTKYILTNATFCIS